MLGEEIISVFLGNLTKLFNARSQQKMKEEVWVTYAFLPACLTIIWSKKLISDSLLL